jgi:hypothetical protein
MRTKEGQYPRLFRTRPVPEEGPAESEQTMNRSPFASAARALAILIALSMPAAMWTQDAAQAHPKTSAAAPDSDAEWLVKTSKLYYSSSKAGLTGFDCSVHPDWRTLVMSTSKGEVVADDDPRITLLQGVRIGLHARMNGGSTVEWEAESAPDKPLDENSTAMLNKIHQTLEQTLQGFMQFWSPFMEVAIVPNTTEGLEITHTPTAHTIHAKQGETELTEVFANDLVLEQFNVNLNGVSIKFSPAYKPTPQGLLVHGFEAHILPAGATPEKTQVMKVGVEYQSLNGQTIPGQLNMEIVGAGTFNFAFDGCTVNPK